MSTYDVNKITIERPDRLDVTSIEALFERVLKDNWLKNGLWDLQADLHEEIEVKKAFLALDFDTQGKEKYFLIAKVGETVVGTIEIGEANDTIKACDDELLNQLPEIGTVFVLPEFQGKGIGSKLMEAMGEHLRKERYKGFCIDSGYKSAQGIWLYKFGAPTYLLKDHWGPGLDHMVWKVLF